MEEKVELTVVEGGLAENAEAPEGEVPFQAAEFVGIEGIEEFPGAEGGETPQDLDLEMMAMQVAIELRQLVAAGEQIAALLVNPTYLDGLKAKLMELDDEVFPPAVKERLQMAPEPNVQGFHFLTMSHIEGQFLMRHFGPREQGGNGFLPRMQQYFADHNIPVQITVDYLRNRFLDSIADRIIPNLVVGADVHVNAPPNLLRK